ncbi:glycosyltransferase family 17 protein [Infundibulicybe gibba]|nr:glycosyltransferase family 17 protein [Infundibulicybe gibba]
MNNMLLWRRKFKLILLPTLIFSLSILYFIIQYQYQIKNALSYATRPIWDSADGPTDITPHYYAEGVKMDLHMCGLHGWGERQEKRVRVLDSVLMSSEVDLLEIRMNELDSVVDNFFIVESNATFTGLEKNTFFAENRARFSKFEKKIIYQFLPGFPLQPGQSAWGVEAHTRNTMTSLLRQHISTFPQGTETVVLMSDVDEIPYSHTLALLKACNFGESIHLQLKNFLYSFEWYLGPTSWRASVHLWKSSSIYRHSMSTNKLLADAGWHCSYCFRTIPEYVIKMKGFSHADRIGGQLSLLDPKRIQETICRGKDIFGMLPEAYSYLDLFSQMSLEPLTSAVGLPRFLIDNAERFRFLLPGGCIRS